MCIEHRAVEVDAGGRMPSKPLGASERANLRLRFLVPR